MIDGPSQHAQPAPPGGRKPKFAQKGVGQGLMMIACCIPMLVIAVVLVATGVVGAGFIFVALGCTAMMAFMMRGMNHGGMNHGSTERGGVDHRDMDHCASRPLAPPPPRTDRGRPNDP